MKDVIVEKLKEIEEKENVRIIMAIESGSRAWEFASPDSDYDVRFIYVRKREDYLKLNPVRDVIEWQLDETLDINGWDVKKALQLLYKSNPTIIEWCSSPIVYKSSEEFEELKKMVPNYFSEKKNVYHYWHMAETNYRTYLKTDEVKIKKYFYVLRPILAAKWILDKKCSPPMSFSELMENELINELKPCVQRLLEMKKETPEMGLAEKIQSLNDYIDSSLIEIKEEAEKIQDKMTTFDELDTFFLKLLS